MKRERLLAWMVASAALACGCLLDEHPTSDDGRTTRWLEPGDIDGTESDPPARRAFACDCAACTDACPRRAAAPACADSPRDARPDTCEAL